MPAFDYAPAPESRSIVDIQSSYGLFINGSFVEPQSGAFRKTVNPAIEEVLADVAEAGESDVDAAVRAARHAYDQVWGPMRGADRSKYLFRIARIIQERARELAVLESIDNGKPIRESRDVDIPLVAAHFFYYAGWADKLQHAGFGASPRPVGVAGQVIPWNVPMRMLAWKIAPALATGNTVVLKPAETTPLTALAFADICQQADLPPGVVNIITGGGEAGRLLVEHPDVDKVAFTGSTEVGRAIASSVAGTHKRLTLELGGKAANIVFDDAPIDQAIEGIVNGIFFNQGHVCCAGSRPLVQESVADDVLDRLKRRMATLRVGDPLDKNTDIGAINSAAQLERIRELSAAGESEGADRWSPPCELPARGFWFAPTLFTGVSQAHRVAREEIFGPVLSVLTFRTPAEAVEKANNTPYGLSAGIWTEKGSRILAIADKLRAGVRGWSGATAYNRGQILYRIAEMLEGRRAQFVDEVAAGEGIARTGKAESIVDAAIDRWVWYAGWSDKVVQIYGNANPVAGPYFNLTVPEPTGVVAVLAPQNSSLLGLVSVVAPVIVTGNTCVVLASDERPLPAITLAEVLATSDLPGGVVNLLTGHVAEVAPWLAAHMDVNAIDLTGTTDAGLAVDLEIAAAENLKRVLRPRPGEDWRREPALDRLLAYLEPKTVWHPKGM